MPKLNIRNAVYALASEDEKSAELIMYGDIYESRPTDWDGNPIAGDFITLDQFMADLDKISSCTDVTIRMNSYGGDAVVSGTIHNRLRELSRNGTKLTCIVDGVAMSGGSLIMCACDTVKVNPSSLVMVHKAWAFLFGGYNADELREAATQSDAYDKMQVSIYQRKTGLSETVLLHMMSDTTYMTGREAVEKGFADELIEDAEDLNISASADGRTLYCRGREMHLCPGLFAPDTIPTAEPGAKASAANNDQPDTTGSHEEGGRTVMASTIEELRAEYPELTAQLEAEARSNASANAVQIEQTRLQEIDAIAGLYSDELVQAAKYGDQTCTAQELAYRAAVQAAGKGRSFLADLDKDNAASGTEDVEAAPAGEEDPGEDSPEAISAQAKADVAKFMKKEGK